MRRFLFADEAGDFEFSRKQGASRYFIVCTVTMDACHIGHKLMELRRDLAWNKEPLRECFHASEDKQVIRNQVFALIQTEDLRIDATIMEKSKAQPQVRCENPRFYQTGWFFHFRNIAPTIIGAKT